MAYADRVKETSPTTGTGAIALAGAASGFRTFAAGFTVGATMPYAISDAAGNWETGVGTLTGSTTLARTTVNYSSNGNALVSFPAGSKDVFCTLSAAQITAFQVSQDVAFSTTIPLNVAGTQYMPQQTVSSVLAFTAAGSPVKGASVYVRLLADGTNAPTFTGMKEWGGSLGYDNRSLIANQIQFFNDGYDTWYSISQAVGAVPAPAAATGVTMTGPTSGVASTASTNFSVGVTPVGGTISGTVVVTPSDSSGGGTFTPTTVSLTSGAPTGTFTYTPNSTITTRTISVTNNGSLTNPSNISYSVTAAATVPGAPSIGTATGGNASASVTFTAPGSNGGSAILDYTVTSSPGGFTATGAGSPLTVSGLTNGTAYTFTVKARNAVGLSAASAASNSVTPAAVVTTLRFGQLSKVTESGTSPNYVYTADSTTGATGYNGNGILNVAFQSGVDGTYSHRSPSALPNAFIWGISTSAAPVAFASLAYGVYVNSGGGYSPITAGGIGSGNGTTVTFAANDIQRMQRVGSTITAQVSKDAGTTWVTFHTWSAASTAMFYINLNLNSGNVIDQLTGTGLA
jgi:hypothetical protein